MKQVELIPILTKAIQEQNVKIKELENKLLQYQNLESRLRALENNN